ncbi:MAG: hypothetical protein IT434_11770 [Phycisphaerales bacterium]|jgi:hypothetical protein|nr:hypothetical protein [Phycisphaerales bacterium]
MRPDAFRKATVALIVIGAMYLLARAGGWTGPRRSVELDTSLLYPGIALISLWGFTRLARKGEDA